MRATCCADDLPKLKPFPWERIFPGGTPSEAVDLAQRLLRYDPDQRLTASQALVHPFFDGAQALIEGSEPAEGKSPITPLAPGSSSKGLTAASDWERRLQRRFDELTAEGGSAPALEAAVRGRVAQLVTAEAAPAELAAQVAAAVRQELTASLKSRDDEIRALQKRVLAEAQQLQLSLPAERASTGGGGGGGGSSEGDGAAGVAAKLERELADLHGESRSAAERAAAEKESLLAQIKAAQQQLQLSMAASGGGAAREPPTTRDAGIQTDEVSPVVAPPAPHGRRAAAAPTRQGTMMLEGHVAVASPIQTRPGGEPRPGAGLMGQGDNLGQVTPLASFTQGAPSPLVGGLQRSGSSGSAGSARGRRGNSKLSEEGSSADAPAPVPES